MVFMERLRDWELTPQLVRRFDEVINRPIPTPPSLFQTRLFRLLVDFLLEQLRLPRSAGAMAWEWKALYRLGDTVDPYYFSEEEIRATLERWTLIEPEKRQVLLSVLTGFFHLRRAGFPQHYPSPLLSNGEVERWLRLFPPEWGWRPLDVLRSLGFATMGGRHGYRAMRRFVHGEYQPELDLSALRRWHSLCWEAAPAVIPDGAGETAAYKANFVAVVFAGWGPVLGPVGPCDAIPRCGECALSDGCAWFNAPASERPGPSEVLALARRGVVEHLAVEKLLQGLFLLRDGELAQMRDRMSDHSLRTLSTQNAQELKQIFGMQELLPERMRVLFELSKRFSEERMPVGATFHTPWDVFKHFRMRLRDLKQERFIVVLLDNQKRYMGDTVITQGTLTATPVHPREVFNVAIRESAASVLIVHNHPSGDPKPSQEDLHVTKQLIEVGEMVGIPVLDHIIVADEHYVSMLEQGLLQA